MASATEKEYIYMTTSNYIYIYINYILCTFAQ